MILERKSCLEKSLATEREISFALERAVQTDIKGGFRRLMSVCHDFFLDDDGCAGAKLCAGNALCGIDTLQLNGIHFNIGVFLCFYMCLGVNDAFAAAVPLTDVLFDINNLGIFAKEETVNPFMDRIITAAVMDAAAGR